MLRNAAQMSGITVEEFVSESTAAFFANYAELKGDGTVAVFDWGGGTLDVSVLEHRRGSVRELATSGMPVAGDALDETLARRIHAMISRERGLDVAFDDMDAVDKDQILVRSEELKRSFSKEDSVRLLLMRYGDVVAYTKYLSYEWFEEVLSPIVEDAMRCLENAIRQAGSTPAGIDRVLLVGGSSNLRPLQEKMRERYGDRLYMSGDPLWCVSKGSAVLSHLHGAYVSAQDVSVVLADGTHYALLHEGERVDGWHKVFDFGVTDTSETVRVVFAGSRDIEGDDSRFRTIDVPGYGFLEERLRLEAEVDKNHVFRVRMKSTMRPDRDSEVWEYDKLKLSYDISGWN
jgi:molecular chaperone DnaK